MADTNSRAKKKKKKTMQIVEISSRKKNKANQECNYKVQETSDW